SRFFHYSPAHRVLHSFPTRRSSDLAEPATVFVAPPTFMPGSIRFSTCAAITANFSFRPSTGPRPALGLWPWTWQCRNLGHTCNRSEEHTSELQSRSDLVCRLLLEKK